MDPCKVCGGTEANLVDGYYYCVECGTQDVNIQETIVEQTIMADGTFAHATVRKFTVAAQDGIEMSSEWHKWHTFNFILAGLTDELIALGAKPSLRMKVLWVWSRYMKCFQVKDASESKSKLDIDDVEEDVLFKNGGDSENQESSDDDSDLELKSKCKKAKLETFSRDIRILSKGTLLTILYVALNLDRSDIQLSHLLRFVREGRLSLFTFMKYVPKELNITTIRNWKSFILSPANLNPTTIRAMAMTCFKRLKLGLPLVPNLRKLVTNYIQELCLPDGFKHLVIALMHYIPIDFLDIDSITLKSLVRIPDYEGVCMSFILVAFKMCFGLDGDYELRISEEIERINDEENYLKSYKLGMFSEPSDRLFSFKEWCQHLQYRKLILGKYFLPISRQFNTIPDDCVFMEHLEKRKGRDIQLSDDVTMDILNKIQPEEEQGLPQVIPIEEFYATLTPMTSYVEVISQYIIDPDIRLLLCEDFTQYSLKYILEDLKLPFCLSSENVIVGIAESGKIINDHVIGTLKVREGDASLIYVRNCENQNWLKTKPPAIDHVTKIAQSENTSDKESDHGYDSNVENSTPETLIAHVRVNDESDYHHHHPEDKKMDVIEALDESKQIFDDDFKDINQESCNDDNITVKEERLDNYWEINSSGVGDGIGQLNNHHQDTDISVIQFNPNTCDREKMIAELIELARLRYKIPAPKDRRTTEPRKRRVTFVNDEALSSEPKKKRSKPGEIKAAVNRLISAYYNTLENDVLNQVTEQVKSLIENVNAYNDLGTVDFLHNTSESNVLEMRNVVNDSITTLNSVENAEPLTEININGEHNNATDKNQEVNSNDQNSNNVALNESIEDEVVETFKSDPNFDEETHDIKQLYVKLCDDFDATDLSIINFEDVPEIDKIIQNKIDEYSNIDNYALQNSKIEDNITDASDSEDEVPLSTVKEALTVEKEKKDRRNAKLEPLIPDTANVQEFKYWMRHYRSRCVERSTDIGKKFDFELNENLPISFVLVIRECAALLGCSMFSIYKNMQNIERFLIP